MSDRMMEYQQLMNELEQPVPRLEHTLERARQRSRRRNWIQRPVISMAAVFVCFVLLVNFCTPVAYACSQIPGLRELAAAVTFSRSLSDAVENEYVQPVDIVLTDNGVTLSVEYLIVDQKQVNVFFRLDSEVYEAMAVTPDVLDEEGGYQQGCSYGCNDYQVPNGELQSMTIDFIDNDVPSELRIQLKAENVKSWVRESVVAEPIEESAAGLSAEEYTSNIVAEFDFMLKFDPQYTAAGRVVPVNQTVELDGQQIIFTDLEIYPTHLRVNVEAGEGNTAWLKHLYFYIETDWGMKFEPVANGITATGEEDSPMMVSYRADSTYFYEANHVNIMVTGATWLEKDMERVYVNLATGEAGRMPEGTQVDSVKRVGDDWKIMIRAKSREGSSLHQVFGGTYYDAEDVEYFMEYWQIMPSDGEGNTEEGYFYESFRLENYPYEEVWLEPVYSKMWTAEEPIEIKGW